MANKIVRVLKNGKWIVMPTLGLPPKHINPKAADYMPKRYKARHKKVNKNENM